MKFLPREHRELVEKALREYPIREEEYKALEKTITDLCRPSSLLRVGASGAVTSEQERIVEAKESNARFQWLECHVETIKKGLRRLNRRERAIVRMFFWEGYLNFEIAEWMHLEIRYFRRLKAAALTKLARVFIPAFSE